MILLFRYCIGCMLLFCLAVFPARASISFEKTLFVMTADEAFKGFTFPLLGLKEDGDSKYVSVRVFKWVQSAGSQVELVANADFDVYPQLVRVALDSRRSIRLKLKQPISATEEQYFRIVLEEFDRLDGTDRVNSDTAMMAIRVKPKVTIPLVITPFLDSRASATSLQFVAARQVSDGLAVTVRNMDKSILRVRGYQKPGANILPVNFYIFAGAESTFVLPGADLPGALLFGSVGDLSAGPLNTLALIK